MNNIKYGSSEWRLHQYNMAKKSNLGHNYQYWSENIHGELLKNGWSLYQFTDKATIQWSIRIKPTATSSEIMAKKAVDELRLNNNYARIVAGYSKNRQMIKMFSIIYKKK